MRAINITSMAFLFSSFIHIAILSINQDMDKSKYEMPDRFKVKLVQAINREIEKKKIVKSEQKGIAPVNKSNIKSVGEIKSAEDFLETEVIGETTHSPTEETYTPKENPVISEIRRYEDFTKDSIKEVSEIITEDETPVSQRDTKDDENNPSNLSTGGSPPLFNKREGDETSVNRQEDQNYPLISSFSKLDASLGKDKEMIDLSAIGEELRRKIDGIKGYPYLAMRRGLEGTVIIFIKLDMEGSLIQCHISRSSGYEALDIHAVSLVKKICPFKHTANRNIEIELPVIYRLIR